MKKLIKRIALSLTMCVSMLLGMVPVLATDAPGSQELKDYTVYKNTGDGWFESFEPTDGKYILSVGSGYEIDLIYSSNGADDALEPIYNALKGWDAVDTKTLMGGTDSGPNESYVFLTFTVTKIASDLSVKLSDDVTLTFSTVESNSVDMFRMYNPNSGEHFYTADAKERTTLDEAGWNYEGIGWTAPKTSSTPVYRLYSGTDHHYTTDKAERDNLIKVGWKDEGIGWYSDDSKSVPLYRQFNPYVEPTAPTNNSGSHNYTTNSEERDALVKVGWRDEGIAWYGMYDYSQDDD